MTQGPGSRIELGMEGFCERVVTHEWTLSYMNPDWPAVFTTPAMIGMMEIACSQAIKAALPPGSITVGVRIEVDHIRPAPAGAKVIAASRLAEIHGRRLIFEVQAHSGEHLIGRGRVFHVIVEYARFVANAAGKPASG